MTQRFQHDEHELNWTPSTSFGISMHGQTWRITPSSALWVPAGTWHRIEAQPNDVIFPLRFPVDLLPELPPQLRTPSSVHVTPQLRATMMRVVESHLSPRFSMLRESRQVLTLLPPLTYPHLQLPEPEDPLIASVAAALRDDPASCCGIEDWAKQLDVSSRTVLRRFHAATGMTFSAYRSRARLAKALALLSSDRTVEQIARQVGYSTASSFTTAFRHTFGRTPASFLVRASDWTAERAASEAAAAAAAAALEQETEAAYRERFGIPQPADGCAN